MQIPRASLLVVVVVPFFFLLPCRSFFGVFFGRKYLRELGNVSSVETLEEILKKSEIRSL